MLEYLKSGLERDVVECFGSRHRRQTRKAGEAAFLAKIQESAPIGPLIKPLTHIYDEIIPVTNEDAFETGRLIGHTARAGWNFFWCSIIKWQPSSLLKSE